MIRQAIILAAGLGSRLRDIHDQKPKAFIEVGGKPLIVRSIEALLSVGIDHIVIGVGHQKDYFEALATQYPVTCVYASEYASTGSLETLSLCVPFLYPNEGTLLLESDLLYEKQALRLVLDSPYHTAILSTAVTEYGDEVFIERTFSNRLVAMSKILSDLSSCECVLVGITKLSFDHAQKLSQLALPLEKHYEDGLVCLARSEDVFVVLRELQWCEVDTKEHYRFACETVWPAILKNETVPFVTRNILLNPGPATTTDTVKYAQVVPDICPREVEFGALLSDLRIQLTEIVGSSSEYTAVLLGGSGTAAVDAMLSSVVSKGALVISNGAYGKRMEEILSTYNIPFVTFVSDPVLALSLSDLDVFMKAHQDQISHVCVVHHETTTGLLNPLQEVGVLCHRYGFSLCVDAVSSYGAVPIDMKDMHVDFLASTANKNLQGIAGVAFVIASRKKLEETHSFKARNYYLNLWDHYVSLENSSQTRFTPPVQALYALRQALLELKVEGVSSRYARYVSCFEVLIEGLTALGLSTLVANSCHGKLITTVVEPQFTGYTFDSMHDYLYERGFTIYPGKLSSQNTFRIATIGQLYPEDIYRFLKALGDFFQRGN